MELRDRAAAGPLKQAGHEGVDQTGERCLEKACGKAQRDALMTEIGLADTARMSQEQPT